MRFVADLARVAVKRERILLFSALLALFASAMVTENDLYR